MARLPYDGFGQPLNAYYGFVMEGIYQMRREINEQLYATDDTYGAAWRYSFQRFR